MNALSGRGPRVKTEAVIDCPRHLWTAHLAEWPGAFTALWSSQLRREPAKQEAQSAAPRWSTGSLVYSLPGPR